MQYIPLIVFVAYSIFLLLTIRRIEKIINIRANDIEHRHMVLSNEIDTLRNNIMEIQANLGNVKVSIVALEQRKNRERKEV
jgi:prefoldin subunit 5